MEDKKQSPKEKYDALLKEIRLQKSLPSLEKIYEDLKANKSSLYDNNVVPFQFSNDLIWLLQNNLIKIDTQLDIYKLYVDAFFEMQCKPEDLYKTNFVSQIYNLESNFFKSASNNENFLVFLNRFYNIYYPKDNTKIHELGDVMDILVSDDVHQINLFGWIQMPIKKIDKEKNIYIFEDYKDNTKEIMISIDSFKVQEKNTFVKEEEMIWRNNLKIGDKVDFLNSNKNWVEGYVKEIDSNGDVSIDALGEIDPKIIFLKKYSPFIQPLLKYSFPYEPEEKNSIILLEKNLEFQKYYYFIFHNDNNYCVPLDDIKVYSLEYFEMVNYFIKKMFSTKIFENESLPIEYMYILLNILYSFSRIVDHHCISKYFYEKCYENIKKILLEYSLNKKKNISKNQIDYIFIFMDRILQYNFYVYKLTKVYSLFIFIFGYNCFKSSEILEKRLLGLNSIIKILVVFKHFFPIIDSKKVGEITALITDKLLNNSPDNDFFGLLYNVPNIHEQLLLKGSEVIINVAKLNILDDKDIERLYNFAISSSIESEAFLYLYNLLKEMIPDLSLSQRKVIFNKVITFPYDKIREQDINLVKDILQNINSKDDFLSMAKSFLDYYYNYVINFKQMDVKYNPTFGITISYAKDQENINYLYVYYFEKIVKEIIDQTDLIKFRFYFTLIHSLFNSFDILNKNEKKLDLSFVKSKFREIFLQNFKDFGVIVDKILILNSKEEKEENEGYIKDVIDIVEGLTKYIYLGDGFITLESFLKLSDYFVFGDILRKKRTEFLYYFINSDNIKPFKNELYDCIFKKLDNFIDSITSEKPERFALLDEKFLNAVIALYEEINNKYKRSSNDGTAMEIYNNYILGLTEKINPLENKYFDIIWKFFYKSKYHDRTKRFLENFSLKNFSPSERHDIWEKLVKKIFSDINSNIYVGLKMLEYILNFSEQYGNGGAVSHFCNTRKKQNIKLNLTNQISPLVQNFNEEKNNDLNSNSTLYDVKKEIHKKYGIDPIFIEFSHPVNKNQNLRDSNSEPLFKIFPKIIEHPNEKCSLIMKKSMFLNNLHRYPLMTEDKSGLMDKFLEVLGEIYNKYAKDGKLDINNYKQFFHQAMNFDSSNNPNMESQGIATFHKFDMGNKGYWTCDDFIMYYGSAIEQNENAVFIHLMNLGYTMTLDHYLSPIKKESPLYYEPNNVKEYMPRYFIGNNKEYMSKLFTFAKYDNKEIHELAQNLLKELSTFEEMKKTIFENNNKIDGILANNNLELRAYAYDILLSEFEKNDDLKDEVTQNLTNNFINNNLYKLIIELDKLNETDEKPSNEDNKKEEEKNKNVPQTLFYHYYLSNLKILFYAFKTIINNKELITIIDKFEDLEDENDKNNIKIINIALDEDKKNLIKKLNFDKLVNIIGNNYKLFEKNPASQNRLGARLSIKILTYVILLSKDLSNDEKKKIYKNFLSHQIRLIKSGVFSTKRNLYLMNKIILTYMNEEKDKLFVNMENEELIKEIKEFKNLNAFKGQLILFFKEFNDLYEVSIKDSKNDEIFSFFEELLTTILDNDKEINEYILTGYLDIIKRILSILVKSKYQKIIEYNFESLVNKLINDFLITFDRDEKNKIIELQKLKKYSKYSEYNYVEKIYLILDVIISLNPEKYIKLFFENEEIKNVKERHLTNLEEDKNSYSPKSESIKSGYVGLKNLSCLCYINSVIQQFFMIPLFQNVILSLPIDPNYKEEKDYDNLLYQLQKMFYYLKYSEKEHYNPKFFVFSFKDYDGNPTNINVQCDAQEFLSRLIEKIEESLKNTSQQYLCSNIFRGSTLQQVKCTNPECGNISERKENINYLSLDIKGNTNIYECLEKFIVEEKIEDYHCEKCDKKITHIKNVLIDRIPNILIIHLQRIAFSYETFNMDKINNLITFEDKLNIKKYTINKDNNDIPSDYFDYELQGVLIHSGTAQYGHYYSVIYSEEKEPTGKWYKFNDTQVSESSFEQVETDAFGNNINNDQGSSAYMLIYQKKSKKPVIINNKIINEKIKKILDENKEKNMEKIDIEGKIYYIYENETETIEKNINYNKEENKTLNINKNIIIKNGEIEANLVSYEEDLNLLKKLNDESREEKPFINTIFLENIRLCNDKKFFTKGFTKFILKISEYLKKEILEDKTDKTNTKINIYITVLKTINDFIINILAKSNYKDELNCIIENITDIYQASVHKELLTYLIKDIIEPIKEKLYINYFVSRDRIMGNDIGKYIAKIICCCLNNNIEIETAMKIIQFYIDKIPVEITKNWIDMESFNYLILDFIEYSDIVKKTFIQNGMISKLIDFILGRSSPLYQGDDRTENKYNKGKFGPIVKSIALLFNYYIENHIKEEIKLSASDLKMINHSQFYERVVLDDYDNNACNLLIDNKMKLSLILDNDNNKEEFDKEIVDILIKLKIPSIKKREEIISGLELIINLIKKYSEIFLSKENNSDKFLEKLNILLGIPVPSVTSGEAQIKYISGKYNEYNTILTNISKEKETNKDEIPLLTSIFNLLNINNMIFTYMDNLPAPNSAKYSYLDYLLKLFVLIEKQNESEFKIYEEMGRKNPIKDLSDLVNDICKKNNKDLNIIRENQKICITDSLYFNDFSFNAIKDIKNTEKVTVFEMTIQYASLKIQRKTDLPCFNKRTYFSSLISRKSENNSLIEDGIEQHILACILISCSSDMILKIDFKPYIYSKIEISGKKDFHYFLYCMDYDNDSKKIDYSKMNIEAIDNQPLALPSSQNDNLANKAYDACTINCSACGAVNILDESNTEFKCIVCGASLF